MSGYFDAFKKNGYYAATRGTVSNANDNGVVVAIMQPEIKTNSTSRLLYFDSREVENWYEIQGHKPGNRERIVNLIKCRNNLGDLIDVIIFNPDDKKDVAEFWNRPGSHWKLTYLDEETGHHRIELFKS